MESINSDMIALVRNTLSFWQGTFNLSDRRSSLEAACLEMKEQKAASIVGRRRLNDITRSFRSRGGVGGAGAAAASASTATNPPRSNDAAIASAVAATEAGITEVLKAYQDEVDQLARRAKFGEVSAVHIVLFALIRSRVRCVIRVVCFFCDACMQRGLF